MIKSSAAWAGAFVTVDSTGAITAATGTPVGTLYVDGVANGATVTVSGSNPYKWAVTLPSLTAGQRVEMYITATVDGTSTAGFVAGDQADTSLASDLATTIGAAGAGLTAVINAQTGSGAEEVRYRVFEPDGITPVEGAEVWFTVTNDPAAVVVAGTVVSEATGYCPTVFLDPGTYYVWVQKAGFNFTNPDTIVVT